MKKTKKLRELLNSKKITRLVGAHNAVSAKLVEKNNFDAIWASGFEISTSYGMPDTNILTLTDLVHVTGIITNAVSIPVLVDGDSGFGNCHNVMQSVRLLESRGVAGICIEDKPFPKVNSFIDCRQSLIDVDEFCGRIMAAKDAQIDSDLVIVARIEALISGLGMEEALKRAYKYQSAGADALLIHSKKDTTCEIDEFMGHWNGNIPVIIVPTTYPSITLHDMDRIGISGVIYANQGLRCMVKATDMMLKELYNSNSLNSISNQISSMDEIFSLQNMSSFKEVESKYLNNDYITNRLV